MDVSIIIVNYHTEALIMDAVASIVDKTRGVECEIILVDSSAQDGKAEALETLKCDIPVRYVAMPENLGFGAANNEGFRYASGKYLFCLNPDTLLVNNAIKELFDYMESHPRCGACGGNLYHENMHRAISFRRILPGVLWEFSEGCKRFPEHVLYGKNSRFNHTGHPIKVGYITGADLMLRAELIEKIGGFAPEFFMYFEETDLCCRIHRAGYDVMSVPSAKIIHLEGKSMGDEPVNPKKYEYYANSRLEYYRRNVSLPKTVRAYRYHLKNLCKEIDKEGLGGDISRIHYKYTLAALETYPELKSRLRIRPLKLNFL